MRHHLDRQVSRATDRGRNGLMFGCTDVLAAAATPITPRLLIPALAAATLLLAGTSASGADTEHTTAQGSDIVYQTGGIAGDGIYLMASDGSDVRPLLEDPGGPQFHPDWSPDGSRIAFELEDEDSWDIWSAAADGSDPALLVDRAPCPEGVCLGVSNPAWSPDGQSVAYWRAYVAPGDVLRSDIEVMDIATGETRVIASAPPGTVYEHPRWTPNSASLVYTFTSFTDPVDLETHTGGGIAIVSTATPGAEPRGLTDPTLFASYPDVRASDGLIVFTTHDLGEFKDPAPASNLYTIRPDGSGLTQLTDYGPGERRAGQPTWTPDGERILFTLGGSGSPPVAAFIDEKGDGLTVLPPIATHPRLRPEGASE
jgi:Tol biopolymer transport system component